MNARHLIREEFHSGPAPGCLPCYWLSVWTFFYSDGTAEQIRQLECYTSPSAARRLSSSGAA